MIVLIQKLRFIAGRIKIVTIYSNELELYANLLSIYRKLHTESKKIQLIIFDQIIFEQNK